VRNEYLVKVTYRNQQGEFIHRFHNTVVDRGELRRQTDKYWSEALKNNESLLLYGRVHNPREILSIDIDDL
jgi:hypothetical protein